MKILLCTILLLTMSLWGQIRTATITDESDPASKTVMTALRSRISSHPKQFTLVDSKDLDTAGLVIQADCLTQKQKTDAFVCYYTSHYFGGKLQTFMGGGIYGSTTPDDVADNFLASIAQDIVERWNDMVRANAIENLEACLMLTQSSCKVPDSLVPELKVKIINMSQYFQHGALKK
jgi:hypothetical protein